MKLQEERVGETLVIRPNGRLDTIGTPLFEQRLLEQLDVPASRLVIDLSGVDYITSAGLRALLRGAKRAASTNLMLALCGLQPRVREALEIVGFVKLFRIHPDLASAVARDS